MRKITACLGVVFALAIATPSKAALIGIVAGPLNSLTINMNFINVDAHDILSLSLDGSTADAGPLVWNSVGVATGTASTPSPGVAGVGTQVVTFTFAPGDFQGYGMDSFNLWAVDPDFAGSPLSDVTIGDLAGVTVQAVFANPGAVTYQFRSLPGVGLQLSQVPLPAAAPLFAAALLSLGFVGWRRMQKAEANS